MTLRVFFYLLIFCLVVPTAAFSLQAKNIAGTLQQLRQIEIEFHHENDVPGAAIPLLTRLKHDLLALFQQVLNEGGPVVPAAAAQEELLRRLKVAGVYLKDWDDWKGIVTYGFIHQLDVTQPSGHPDLIVFRSEIYIQCGEDSSVYIFQKKQGRWDMVITVESNGYKQISGGLGDLQYQVSPPDEHGQWFLVYAYENPWCTSNWQAIYFRALRPGATPEKPVVVLAREEEVFREAQANLEVTRDSFRLEFVASQRLDFGVLTRTHVARYRIAGNRATRIPPLADSPAGFLDEWSRLPQRKAARWSRILKFPRAGHHMLGNRKLYHEFDFVQPCPGGNKWQIGVNISRLGSGAPLHELFATVVKQDESYFITQLGHTRPKGCPGNRQAVPVE
jgi:hypothetical protein